MGHMGLYEWDENALPCYHYTAGCPTKAADRKGRDAALPEDPCCILGNYRITAFAHASGRIEFLTGERGWARLNHTAPNTGWNQAVLNGQVLAGNEPCRMETKFGVGYAQYRARVGELNVQRRVSVMPSDAVNQGIPALLFCIEAENNSAAAQPFRYSEQILANYCMLSAQESDGYGAPAAVYTAELEADEAEQIAGAQFRFSPRRLLPTPHTRQENFPYDCFPPLFFIKAEEGGTVAAEQGGEETFLCCNAERTLLPGEKFRLRFVVGLSFAGKQDALHSAHTLLSGDSAVCWKKRLPDFSGEAEEVLRWEMLWNAYVLHAMATYHSYFGETTIPQGSVYAYRLGQNASMRDHLQHCLAAVCFDPKLAKSCLRFVLQHECRDGRILRQDVGFGYENKDIYFESDPQIYLMMAVAEYLRVTKDYAFLQEQVRFYPVENRQTATVLDALVRAFAWLRDVVGIGRHGLVMMRNSDWSDSFFHPYSPNIYALAAESHMNTAMVLAVFPKLIEQLECAAKTDTLRRLIEELKEYRAAVYRAFARDMDGRVYAPRCYIGFDDDPALRFGEDRLCLEAQIWLLQVEDYPAERRQRLWQAVYEKVVRPEKLGARTRERPLWSKEGSGEDGGIWFSHQGPLLLGVAGLDKVAARKMLKNLTFRHFAECYPHYWVGHWTAADSVESSLSSREGLYHAWCPDAFQPYCAHLHAWMLYSYYRLYKEEENHEM